MRSARQPETFFRQKKVLPPMAAPLSLVGWLRGPSLRQTREQRRTAPCIGIKYTLTETPPPASSIAPITQLSSLTFQNGNRASSKAPHAVSVVRGIIRPSGPNGCGKRDLRAERALSPDESPPAIARTASPVCVTASRQPTIGLVATPANPWKIPVMKPCIPSSCSHSTRAIVTWGV